MWLRVGEWRPVILSSHRRPRLSCLVRVDGVNFIGDKSRQFSVVFSIFETEQFCLVPSAKWKLGGDRTKLSSYRISRQDKTAKKLTRTRQDSLVLFVSAAWTRHKTWSHHCWHSRLPPLAVSSTEDRVQDARAVYKCLHQSTPIYLSELCIPVAASAERSHLRSAVHSNLIISYCRTKRYGQRSFAFSGPALWNSLPLTARDPSLSLTQFCAKLKSVRLSRAQWYIPIVPLWQSRL